MNKLLILFAAFLFASCGNSSKIKNERLGLAARCIVAEQMLLAYEQLIENVKDDNKIKKINLHGTARPGINNGDPTSTGRDSFVIEVIIDIKTLDWDSQVESAIADMGYKESVPLLRHDGTTIANITSTSYWPTGQIKAQWGDQTNAVGYKESVPL